MARKPVPRRRTTRKAERVGASAPTVLLGVLSFVLTVAWIMLKWFWTGIIMELFSFPDRDKDELKRRADRYGRR